MISIRDETVFALSVEDVTCAAVEAKNIKTIVMKTVILDHLFPCACVK